MTVKRVASGSPFDDQYIALRECFSRHFSVPTFEVDASGKAQIEQQVNGVCLDELDGPRQLELVKDLMRRLASLCTEHRQSDSGRFVHQALEDLDPAVLPSELTRWLPILRSSKLVTDAPLVPSHGDFLLKNVFVDGSNTWIIDWDSRFIGLRPFWYDALSLFKTPESHYLRNAFIEGRFDSELTGLVAASGLQSVIKDLKDMKPVRKLLAVAWIVSFRYPNMNAYRLNQLITTHFDRWFAFTGRNEFHRD